MCVKFCVWVDEGVQIYFGQYVGFVICDGVVQMCEYVLGQVECIVLFGKCQVCQLCGGVLMFVDYIVCYFGIVEVVDVVCGMIVLFGGVDQCEIVWFVGGQKVLFQCVCDGFCMVCVDKFGVCDCLFWLY